MMKQYKSIIKRAKGTNIVQSPNLLIISFKHENEAFTEIFHKKYLQNRLKIIICNCYMVSLMNVIYNNVSVKVKTSSFSLFLLSLIVKGSITFSPKKFICTFRDLLS